MSVLGGGVGPQVTKFEQVSSGDHQISVAGEGDRCPVLMFVGGKGWGGGQVLRSDIWGGRCPGLCLWERVGAQVCVGGRGRGYPTNPIMHVIYLPPMDRKTYVKTLPSNNICGQ